MLRDTIHFTSATNWIDPSLTLALCNDASMVAINGLATENYKKSGGQRV
jgi:hypothetical protein